MAMQAEWFGRPSNAPNVDWASGKSWTEYGWHKQYDQKPQTRRRR